MRSFFLSFLFLFSSVTSLCQAESLEEKKVLVFDFDGVMGNTDQSATVSFLSRTFGVSPINIEKNLHHLRLFLKDGGRARDYWINYGRLCNVTLDENWFSQLDEVQKSGVKLIPGMYELVHHLKNLGYQTAMLSNVSHDKAQVIRELGLYDPFTPALLSCEIGVKKPEKESYRILLNELKVKPESCIFIDDKEKNIEVARGLNIDGIHFHSLEELLVELKKRGVEIQ